MKMIENATKRTSTMGNGMKGGMKSEPSPRPCTRRINKKHMLFDWLVFGNLPFRIDKLLGKQTRARLLALIATTHCHHTSNKNPPTRGSNSSGHTNIQMSFARRICICVLEPSTQSALTNQTYLIGMCIDMRISKTNKKCLGTGKI